MNSQVLTEVSEKKAIRETPSGKEIIILIAEDNEFYNNLIKTHLIACLESKKNIDICKFSFRSYTNGLDCSQDIKDGSFKGKIVLAFCDYYLQDGINGMHLLKLLKKSSIKNYGILFTQSNDSRVWNRIERSKQFRCLFKNETTPVKCQEILNELLEEFCIT